MTHKTESRGISSCEFSPSYTMKAARRTRGHGYVFFLIRIAVFEIILRKCVVQGPALHLLLECWAAKDRKEPHYSYRVHHVEEI